MEIRFKSSECKEGELVKIFREEKDQFVLQEQEYSQFNEGVDGVVKEIHFNQAYVICQDYYNNNTEEYSLKVSQNQDIFLLQFVIDGELSCFFKGEEKPSFSLATSSYNLFYIPASEHLYRYTSKKKHIVNIYFSESYLHNKMGYCFTLAFKEFQKAKIEHKPFLFFNEGLPINIKLKNILQDFLECSFQGAVKQSFLEAKLTELVLLSLIENNVEKEVDEVTNTDKENLKKVEAYIYTHLKEELNIADLSIMSGLNTSKFKKSFKHIYGTTVFKYITSLRIEKAKELIVKNNFTVSQASYEVGYKNPQHFTVAFKKSLGYLPSELKK